MSIDIFINGNKPEPFDIQNGKIDVVTTTVPTQQEEICVCVAQDCDRNLDVYASLTDNSERANDKTSFLFRVMTANDTFTMKLYKNNLEIAILDNNNFGTFYNLGTLDSGLVSDQALYFGYLINWQQVLNLHGVGEYYIETELTLFGAPITITSEKYKLYIYSEEAADGSVRIVTRQNGNIESNPFNYTGMNWYQQIRIKGQLWNKQSEYITDTYFTSNRTITQIQDSIEHTYDLQIEFVQASVSKFIIENNLLANEILISDYNVANTELYNNLRLAVKDITDTTELYYYNGRSHVIQFTDRVQNIRKRNYN